MNIAVPTEQGVLTEHVSAVEAFKCVRGDVDIGNGDGASRITKRTPHFATSAFSPRHVPRHVTGSPIRAYVMPRDEPSVRSTRLTSLKPTLRGALFFPPQPCFREEEDIQRILGQIGQLRSTGRVAIEAAVQLQHAHRAWVGLHVARDDAGGGSSPNMPIFAADG